MIKLHKNNQDLVFQLVIETTDHDTHQVIQNRVKDFHSFVIKVFTNDLDDFIEASYIAATSIYHNIVEQGDNDFLIINSSDLETLDDGMLKLHIEYKISSLYFNDDNYKGCYDIETGLMLVDKRYDNSTCPLPCNLIDD